LASNEHRANAQRSSFVISCVEHPTSIRNTVPPVSITASCRQRLADCTRVSIIDERSCSFTPDDVLTFVSSRDSERRSADQSEAATEARLLACGKSYSARRRDLRRETGRIPALLTLAWDSLCVHLHANLFIKHSVIPARVC